MVHVINPTIMYNYRVFRIISIKFRQCNEFLNSTDFWVTSKKDNFSLEIMTPEAVHNDTSYFTIKNSKKWLFEVTQV